MSQKPWLNHYTENVRWDSEIPNKTLPQVLRETAAKVPDRDALRFYDKAITYRELVALVQAFASALQRKGVEKGDRVAIMLPNCPQYVVAYYGILTVGAVVTQVNPMLVERELEYILKDSGAETILVFGDLYKKVKAVESNTNLENIIIVNFMPKNENYDRDLTFEQFLQTGNGVVDPVDIEPEEDLAVLQYTGGTTGRSKGAMLTHRNVTANAYQCYEFFKEDIHFGQEVCLTVIPLFHVFAMTSGMNLSILAGSTNILLPRFDLEEVLNVIKKEQPTSFPGVPTMYIAITNHPKAEEYGINSIRVCNSGSAPMPLGIMRDFEGKTGAFILEGYGLSEASPVTHCNPSFAERKPGSIGIGIPQTEYKIVDVETGTTELPYGELGELVIKGPQVMKGYWHMPEETENTLRDGWLYTGDIAKMDENGYVYIMDRKKDMIIASGFNVYPRDVEEVLYEHPAVKEAAVIGVPDAYRGETVKAFIVKKDGVDVTEEEIINYCKNNMAAYRVPKIVAFRDELPKTNVGKVLRRALKEEEMASGNQ
ncbi:MAG: long-chain-fatty-acid--CoA ligase [Tuberibacillus sp.]